MANSSGKNILSLYLKIVTYEMISYNRLNMSQSKHSMSSFPTCFFIKESAEPNSLIDLTKQQMITFRNSFWPLLFITSPWWIVRLMLHSWIVLRRKRTDNLFLIARDWTIFIAFSGQLTVSPQIVHSSYM